MSSDNPVRARRKRSLVDDGIVDVRRNVLPFAPGPRKDMMNVDGLIEVVIHIGPIARAPIPRTFLEEQGVQALVSCASPRAQCQQSPPGELGFSNSAWFVATTDPSDDVWKVSRKSSLSCPAVELPEHSAPEPACDLRPG